MSLRPFWKNHPILLKTIAMALLLVSPVLIVVMSLFIVWYERDQLKDFYRELYRLLKHKE